MADDKNKKDQNKYDPLWQDKLEVLRAVLKMEEEKGEEILTREQRKILEEAGGVKSIGGGGVSAKEAGEGKGAGKTKVKRKPQYKTARMVGQGLVEGLTKDYSNIIPEKDWDKMKADEKEGLIEVLFKIKYGCFPDFLIAKMQGGVNDE